MTLARFDILFCMKPTIIVFPLFAVAEAVLPVLAGIDDPAKPWSYFVHPVTCIGMPLQTARTGIQVTPEGTVFTGEHELALFFGDARKPLACRQRRFVDDMLDALRCDASLRSTQRQHRGFRAA